MSNGRPIGSADPAETLTLAGVLTSEGERGWEEAFGESADMALLQRPSVSIRTRITLAFALIFTLCLSITLWAMFALSEVQDKIYFLELADSYTSEIQEARRYEKNFLLYGTNLEDAIQHLARAEALLNQDLSRIRRVVGDAALTTMLWLDVEYRDELQRLGKVRDEAVRKGVEAELRRSGGQMVSLALEYRAKEREAVEGMLTLARRIPFLFLGTLLALMVVIGAFLARPILSALRRFTEYTRRIGAGDFTPILPVRKYRDEFSQLGLALNRMIRELDHRQRILLESHKLRAIGTLVAGVAHELNNPLNNVMLTAALMEENYPTLSEQDKLEMVRDIITQTERSQKIVRNLLDFARESEATMEPLNLGGIVGEAAQLVANQVRMVKAHLGVNVSDKLPPVHGDRQMLCQVFVNLIINALDVVGPRGRIEISVHPDTEEGFLAVDVKDNGPGIPAHLLPRIFDPFFTTKPTGKGTGLGLSVSQGIVRKLGGYIRVWSKVGEGTTFTVVLPITQIPSAVSAHGAP
jgi:two-component system, NtrC family, sensor kinase